MNLAKADKEELLKLLERGAAEEVALPDELWREIMGRISQGSMSPVEQQEAWDRGAARAWPVMVAKFKAGTLFSCHGLRFTDCVLMADSVREEQLSLADRLVGMARSAGQLGSPDLEEINAFVQTRMRMPKPWLNKVREGNHLKSSKNHPPDAIEMWGKLRDAFGATTERWGWAQIAWESGE